MKLLDEDWATEFHHSVAQLLFDTPRVRKDIHKNVSFLTTRVSSPYDYECQKLQQVLKYIISTMHMSLILILDYLNITTRWVDASYAMHPYFRSHTGAMMSLGWVLVASMSKRGKMQEAQRRHN